MQQNNKTIKDNKLSEVTFSNFRCEKNLLETDHKKGLLEKYLYQLGNNIGEDNYIVKFVEANICFADEYDLYGEGINTL